MSYDFNALFQISEDYLRRNNRPYQRFFGNDPFFSAPCGVLLGARGVGKTTLLAQKIAQDFCKLFAADQILFLPVDHVRMQGVGVYDLARTFTLHGGKLLVLDEIHKLPGWSKEIKSVRDQFPELRLFLSGSSALEIQKHAADLTRRAVRKKLPPLSFREFLGMRYGVFIEATTLNEILQNSSSAAKEILAKLAESDLKVLKLFSQYLRSGYLPSSMEFPEESLYYLTLEQNIAMTLEVDIPVVNPKLTGESVEKLKRLLVQLAKLPPVTIEFKKLTRLSELSDERTLKHYLLLLEAAEVITTISKAGTGFKTLRKPEKMYLAHPNLMYALSPQKSPDIGVLRESFFLNALRPKHSLQTHGGADFLVDDDYLFEVGGPNKKLKKPSENFYGAIDGIENSVGKLIPLWLFGFLY